MRRQSPSLILTLFSWPITTPGSHCVLCVCVFHVFTYYPTAILQQGFNLVTHTGSHFPPDSRRRSATSDTHYSRDTFVTHINGILRYSVVNQGNLFALSGDGIDMSYGIDYSSESLAVAYDHGCAY
jgi:hypothetical protein